MKTLKDYIPSEAPTKAKPKKKANGYVLFEGQSKIDGTNIVAILTLKTANVKTGQMAQLWILNAELNPVEASKQGKDKSVCGECKLRQSLGGACYVNLGQAPLAVYKAFKKGNYPTLSQSEYSVLNGLKIRFGAYGDPFAMPIEILTKLKAVAQNNTSYTHQWEKASDELKKVSMASVDNLKEQREAVTKGWRTFRVATIESEILENEIVCPNVTKGISCADCGLCSGASSKAKNIVIPVHGKSKNKFNDQ